MKQEWMDRLSLFRTPTLRVKTQAHRRDGNSQESESHSAVEVNFSPSSSRSSYQTIQFRSQQRNAAHCSLHTYVTQPTSHATPNHSRFLDGIVVQSPLSVEMMARSVAMNVSFQQFTSLLLVELNELSEHNFTIFQSCPRNAENAKTTRKRFHDDFQLVYLFLRIPGSRIPV